MTRVASISIGGRERGPGFKGHKRSRSPFWKSPASFRKRLSRLHGLHREPLGDRGAAVELARRAQGRPRDLPYDLPPDHKAICRLLRYPPSTTHPNLKPGLVGCPTNRGREGRVRGG